MVMPRILKDRRDNLRRQMQLRGPMALVLFGLVSAPACRDKAAPAPPPPAAPAAPAAAPAPALPVAATDGDVYFGVIEPHFQRVTIYAGPDKFLEEYAKTPEKPRHLLAAHWGVAEISHGGFHQLFSSAVGMLVPEAIAGLQAIGLGENAAIMQEASALFGKSYPRDHGKRRRALEAYEKKSKAENAFAALDDRFFAALKAHPGGFDAVAAAYARAPAPPVAGGADAAVPAVSR
jgi:hypothetical protein